MKKIITFLAFFFLSSAFALGQCSDTLYYDSGKIKEIRTFCDSTHQFNGQSIAYFENGKISAVASYVQGVKHGPWRVWHPNGELAYDLYYQYGEKAGEWKAFKEDGELLGIRNYPLKEDNL
jgi:antitoxin component YwqK of YwqJK toxin-antitoxin module